MDGLDCIPSTSGTMDAFSYGTMMARAEHSCIDMVHVFNVGVFAGDGHAGGVVGVASRR